MEKHRNLSAGADPGFLKGGIIGLGLGTHATPLRCVFALLWANNNFIFGSKTTTNNQRTAALQQLVLKQYTVTKIQSSSLLGFERANSSTTSSGSKGTSR